MYKKKLKLNDVNPTKQQMMDLLKISVSVFPIARHDFNNTLGNCFSDLLLIKSEQLPELKLKVLSKRKVKDCEKKLLAIDQSLQRVEDEIGAMFESCRLYFEPYSPRDFAEPFVSRPFDIFCSIKKLYNYSNILIGSKSLKSLEIVYPENILFGILSELVQNVAKSNKYGKKVLIEWKIRGNCFQCEVHDNGPGIVHAKHNKFVPLDVITPDLAAKGLKEGGLGILNRILTISQGLLLFSNSKSLGGTVVHFEFPVIGFYKR